ncbi:hypothetical protein F4861DRAFT_529125 [Xylaria intraflava]|nr:hypothetical protein F4861DRAFT_529125 [Xylaria intraflava]
MGSSALSSTYRLYKQDTDDIAAWLASTAKSGGYRCLSPPGNEPSGSSVGRLKGKARTEAKKKATSPETKHVINIRDFVPLAEYLATKATPVPHTVKITIDRVIVARSGFADKLEKHGIAHSETSDANHRYFIGVLERVREVLMPFMVADPAKQKASTDNSLSNRFSDLVVYEPSQEFLDAPAIERPAKAQHDSAQYEAEAETSLEHALFALCVVAGDVHEVRNSILRIWSNYKTGDLDLAAAAVATNTAIDLVRNMMEDIQPLIKQNGGIGRVLSMRYALLCFAEGWTINDIFADDCELFRHNTYDLGNQSYFNTYQVLEAFGPLIQPDWILLYKGGPLKRYDPTSDRSQKTGREKFEDDQGLLIPFVADLVAAFRGFPTWPIKDEFLRGVEEMAETREVPFYVVFAAQVFLDITYELREDIERPFRTLISHVTSMDKDTSLHVEFHGKLKTSQSYKVNDKWIKVLQQNIQWILGDPIRLVREREYRPPGAEVPNTESHRIFRMSPVLCGLFLYHYRSRYREIGLAVADAWASIQCCQHLYNALYQEGLIRHVWQDMRLIVENLGLESFYVGGNVPTTPRDCLNKICLQLGASVAALNGIRRKNAPTKSKSGARGLKAASPVLSMFKARYVDNSGQVDFTPEHVRQIIELSLFEIEELEGGTIRVRQIGDPKKLREKKKLQQPKYQRRGSSAKSMDMRPERLIDLLVVALDAEALEHTYPYLAMHRQCLKLLRDVKESCDPVLRQLHGPTYLHNESQLPRIVAFILRTADGSVSDVIDRRPLQLAAEVMEGFHRAGLTSFIVREKFQKELEIPVLFDSEDGEGSSEGNLKLRTCTP